jgi:hypothetical protein
MEEDYSLEEGPAMGAGGMVSGALRAGNMRDKSEALRFDPDAMIRARFSVKRRVRGCHPRAEPPYIHMLGEEVFPGQNYFTPRTLSLKVFKNLELLWYFGWKGHQKKQNPRWTGALFCSTISIVANRV